MAFEHFKKWSIFEKGMHPLEKNIYVDMLGHRVMDVWMYKYAWGYVDRMHIIYAEEC